MENSPYTPSAASLAVPSRIVLEHAGSGFRNLNGLTGKLSMLLLVGVGWRILGLVSSLLQLNLLSHRPYSLAQAHANDLRERSVHLGELVLFLITAFVFGRWIYLAHKNLPELGARLLHFSPGWSVGSFFVPILSWWAPYQAMRDLAKASRSPVRWDLEDTSAVIVLWWILWVLVQLLDNGVFRSSFRAHTVQQFQELTAMDLVGGALSVPLYLLALYIVRRIWRDQAENYEQMINAQVAGR